MPRFLGSNRIKRELSILIILAALYFMPAREEGHLFVHSLDLAHTRDNLAALYRAWAQNGRDSSHQSLFERRLGYAPDLDARCCDRNTHTYRELKSVTEEVRRVSGGRSVYLEPIPWEPSMIYFLSNLKVGTSMPDPRISGWTRDDVDRLLCNTLRHHRLDGARSLLPPNGR